MAKMVYWFVDDGIVPEEWIDGEDWQTWVDRLAGQETVIYSREEVIGAMQACFLRHTKDELLELGFKDDATIAPVNTIEDLTRFRQLEERGYWLKAPLPDGQEVNVPGFTSRLSQTPMAVRQWPPRLGQHNQEVLGGMLGFSIDEISAASSSKS